MKKILAVALLSFVFAKPAFAGDSGFYGAVDMQTWRLDNLNGGSNPSTGFRIGGGYHFTKNWGVEVNYAESGSGTLGGLNFRATSLQAGAVNTWHINDMFGLYVKLGLTANKLTGTATTGCSCSKTRVMFGAGGQYNVTNNIGIRLEYDALGDTTNSRVGGDIAASNMSLGIVYDF